MSIGSNIKMLREQRNMTQLGVAKAVVCSIQSVSAWETDKKTPRMGTLSFLAKLFDVPVSAIVDGDEQVLTRLCLSEDEQALLDLYRQIPKGSRTVVLSMIQAALKTQIAPEA